MKQTAKYYLKEGKIHERLTMIFKPRFPSESNQNRRNSFTASALLSLGNVFLPVKKSFESDVDVSNPEYEGYLYTRVGNEKNWKKRRCVLKSSVLYLMKAKNVLNVLSASLYNISSADIYIYPVE